MFHSFEQLPSRQSFNNQIFKKYPVSFADLLTLKSQYDIVEGN